MLKWEGREIPETLAEIVNPAHTVVIMHDIQNDNTGPEGVFAKAGRRIDVTGIVPPIARFLDVARAQKVRVMYTQYTNLPHYATFPDTRIRDNHAVLNDSGRRWTLESSVHGTWGCQTVDELKPKPGETIIDKYRVDAFIGTPLEYLLRLHRVRTIIHTGIATEVGILPTAWHAINLGFFVVVPEDLVGPMQKEYHEDAMAFLKRLTLMTRSEHITKAWREGGA
jgi:nicotinamidase-related amidase